LRAASHATRENLRIRVGDFARLWLTAERRADALETDDREDPYRGACG
jgi:hypothetical protein